MTAATVDPPANIAELAETLTEYELTTGVITAENESEELSAGDRIKQRLERFGNVAPEAKKISRAMRFGTTHEAIDGAAKKRRMERFGVAPHSAEEAQEKKRKRADRFQTNDASSALDDETRKKRVDRFGVVTPSTTLTKKKKGNVDSATPVVSEAIKKRAERFGDVSQTAKTNTLTEQKQKRADRFKPVTTA